MRYFCVALVISFYVFLQPIDAASADDANFRTGIAKIAAKHRAKKVWFRAERAGATLANVAIADTANDAIQVGSLTKSITAIAIALLIQDGKLSLDTTLGEVLQATFTNKGYTLGPSMKAITIRRLLTHTAGLRTNYASDPKDGVQSNPIFRRLRSDARVFEYIVAADGNRSNGSNKFVYSNFSYAFLGLVVEAVSEKPYEVFCVERIFKPLDITDASIQGRFRGLGPYGGWRISTASMMRIWTRVFDRQSPTLLTAKTLDETLLAKLGEPRGNNQDAYYTLGVTIRENEDRSAYRIWHNGVVDYFWADHRYSYMEQTIPGATWMIVVGPEPRREDRTKLNSDVRALVETLSTK
jgi:CubicO group peptidase (beta-lactamase class C family)